MVRTEAARRSASNSGDAVDLVMRARAQSNDIKRRANAARAVELFRLSISTPTTSMLWRALQLCAATRW